MTIVERSYAGHVLSFSVGGLYIRQPAQTHNTKLYLTSADRSTLLSQPAIAASTPEVWEPQVGFWTRETRANFIAMMSVMITKQQQKKSYCRRTGVQI